MSEVPSDPLPKDDLTDYIQLLFLITIVRFNIYNLLLAGNRWQVADYTCEGECLTNPAIEIHDIFRSPYTP